MAHRLSDHTSNYTFLPTPSHTHPQQHTHISTKQDALNEALNSHDAARKAADEALAAATGARQEAEARVAALQREVGGVW